MNGPNVVRLPIPNLLPQFGVLTPQFMDFLAQFENFMTKLPNQCGQFGRLGSQRWGDKRAFHDTDACTQNLARKHRAVEPGKRFGQSSTEVNA